MTEDGLYEDFDEITRDAELLYQAFRYTWQGDPDLVSADHWGAMERLRTGLGLEEDE